MFKIAITNLVDDRAQNGTGTIVATVQNCVSSACLVKAKQQKCNYKRNTDHSEGCKIKQNRMAKEFST